MEKLDNLDNLEAKLEAARSTLLEALMQSLLEDLRCGKLNSSEKALGLAALQGTPISWAEVAKPVRTCECGAAARKGSRFCKECEEEYVNFKAEREYHSGRWRTDRIG